MAVLDLVWWSPGLLHDITTGLPLWCSDNLLTNSQVNSSFNWLLGHWKLRKVRCLPEMLIVAWLCAEGEEVETREVADELAVAWVPAVSFVGDGVFKPQFAHIWFGVGRGSGDGEGHLGWHVLRETLVSGTGPRLETGFGWHVTVELSVTGSLARFSVVFRPHVFVETVVTWTRIVTVLWPHVGMELVVSWCPTEFLCQSKLAAQRNQQQSPNCVPVPLNIELWLIFFFLIDLFNTFQIDWERELTSLLLWKNIRTAVGTNWCLYL